MSLDSLDPRVSECLKRIGIRELFPVQAAVIPAVLAHRDVLVRSPTGSGKTLAYAIPIAQTLLSIPPPPPPPSWRLRALVVVPTRDVAAQVTSVFSQLFTGELCGLRAASATGGGGSDDSSHGIGYSSDALETVDVLVATPGRLLELLGVSKNTYSSVLSGASLEHLRFLVIDEADRMLGGGQNFQEWIPAVMRLAHNSNASGLSSTGVVEDDTVRTSRLPYPMDVHRSRMIQPSLYPLCAFSGCGGDSEAEKNGTAPFFTQETPRLQRMLFSATLVESTRRLLGLRMVNPFRYDSAVVPVPSSDPDTDLLPHGADALEGGEALQTIIEEEDGEQQQHSALATLVSTSADGLTEKAYVMPETLVQHMIVCSGMQRNCWIAAAMVRMGMLESTDKQLLCFASGIETAHSVAIFLKELFSTHGARAKEETEDETDKKKKKRDVVAEYSSELKKHEREKTLKMFRQKKLQVLVTTDVLARGIDLPGVDVVLNLDCPRHIRTYVHRAGRTARAGSVGHVYTLLSSREVNFFRSMLNEAGVTETLLSETFTKPELEDIGKKYAGYTATSSEAQEQSEQQPAEEGDSASRNKTDIRQPQEKRRRTQTMDQSSFHSTRAFQEQRGHHHHHHHRNPDK